MLKMIDNWELCDNTFEVGVMENSDPHAKTGLELSVGILKIEHHA